MNARATCSWPHSSAIRRSITSRGLIARGGDGPLFRRGELAIALPAKFAARLRDRARAARWCSACAPRTSAPPRRRGRGSRSPASSISVLPVGSDRFLGLKVEGSDVFVRVDKEARHQEGAAIGLGLVAERLHLFDKASGLTLRRRRARREARRILL